MPVDAPDTLKLAYAATVRRARRRAIVVPIYRGHHIMLTRNLVPTAVTRAQEVCVVVGELSALQPAVRRTDARLRHTRRLREPVAILTALGGWLWVSASVNGGAEGWLARPLAFWPPQLAVARCHGGANVFAWARLTPGSVCRRP